MLFFPREQLMHMTHRCACLLSIDSIFCVVQWNAEWHNLYNCFFQFRVKLVRQQLTRKRAKMSQDLLPLTHCYFCLVRKLELVQLFKLFLPPSFLFLTTPFRCMLFCSCSFCTPVATAEKYLGYSFWYPCHCQVDQSPCSLRDKLNWSQHSLHDKLDWNHSSIHDKICKQDTAKQNYSRS